METTVLTSARRSVPREAMLTTILAPEPAWGHVLAHTAATAIQALTPVYSTA